MAHLNLDEQEQISRLKYFWRDYGKYIIGILIVAIITYSSSELLTWKNQTQSAQAAIIYEQFTVDLTNNIPNAYKEAEKLQKNFPKNEYTAFATLLVAKTAFTNKELDKASSYLLWVISHSKDNSLVNIAKLRLADVYIDQKKSDEALKIMMEKTTPGFQPLFYEKRGDLYLAIDNKMKARDAYKAALDAASSNQELAQEIQMKLDILGS